MKTPAKSLFLMICVLPLALFNISCATNKISEHPGLISGSPRGYIDFYAATPFGMWMRDLEEGPTTCGSWQIRPMMSLEGFKFYKKNNGDFFWIGEVKELTWPGTLSSIIYRPIADNFSAARVPMPVGDHLIHVGMDTTRCSPPPDVMEKIEAGDEKYNTWWITEVPVYRDRITLVQIHAQKEEDAFRVYLFKAPVALPVPENEEKFGPNPKAYPEYLELLQDPFWGFRWYAAKRLRFVGNETTIPVIKDRLRVETHKDVRNELEKALEKLGG
jgi:hypothetical protein